MRISIVSVEGTPEELASLPEDLRVLLANMGPSASSAPSGLSNQTPSFEAGEIPAELQRFIRSRARSDATAAFIERFAAELLSWEGTHYELGKSSRTTDRLGDMFMIKRTGTGYGGFVYVYPGTTRINFRIDADHASGRRHAYKRQVKPEDQYQVSIKLRSDEALTEALELARTAYDAIEPSGS